VPSFANSGNQFVSCCSLAMTRRNVGHATSVEVLCGVESTESFAANTAAATHGNHSASSSHPSSSSAQTAPVVNEQAAAAGRSPTELQVEHCEIFHHLNVSTPQTISLEETGAETSLFISSLSSSSSSSLLLASTSAVLQEAETWAEHLGGRAHGRHAPPTFPAHLVVGLPNVATTTTPAPSPSASSEAAAATEPVTSSSENLSQTSQPVAHGLDAGRSEVIREVGHLHPATTTATVTGSCRGSASLVVNNGKKVAPPTPPKPASKPKPPVTVRNATDTLTKHQDHYRTLPCASTRTGAASQGRLSRTEDRWMKVGGRVSETKRTSWYSYNGGKPRQRSASHLDGDVKVNAKGLVLERLKVSICIHIR